MAGAHCRTRVVQASDRNVTIIICMISLLASPQRVLADEALSAQVRAQFAAFTRAVAGRADDSAKLERAATWVRAADSDWVFIIDLSGNRILRPAGPWFHPLAARPITTGQPHDRPIWPPAVREELIERSRRLVESVTGLNADQATPHLKQEVVLLCHRPTGALHRFEGRYLVRLRDLPDNKYFQVVYTQDRKPMRIDTDVRDAACVQLAGAITDQAPDPAIASFLETREPLAVGMFFDPGEYRFELRAYSHVGENFLDLSQRRQPFARDHFDLTYTFLVETEAYRRSNDYHRWCWNWWTHYGRVGAARGNWDPQAGQWEHPQVEVRVHRSLASYPLVGGEPREKRKYPKPDGSEHEYPFAFAADFAPPFYTDLDRCHISAIFTHGGHTRGHFRFRRQPDIWVRFEPKSRRPLGHGFLRHLFVEGCNTATYIEDPARRLLMNTWIRAAYIDGVRTICGLDGGRVGRDRSGWRFYGRYNKGDSIHDAWAHGQLDEYLGNSPVMIAYGRIPEEAFETLFEGRFTRERVISTFAAISIWCNPQED